MGNDLLQVFAVDRVEYVEEVLTVRTLIVWVFIMEVDVKGFIILQVSPEILNRQLLPMRDGDIVDLFLLEEPLLALEDIP